MKDASVKKRTEMLEILCTPLANRVLQNAKLIFIGYGQKYG